MVHMEFKNEGMQTGLNLNNMVHEWHKVSHHFQLYIIYTEIVCTSKSNSAPLPLIK